MTAVTDVLATMGGAQKQLLVGLPRPWADCHPSTREALLSRGLAVRTDDDELVLTFRGGAVAFHLRQQARRGASALLDNTREGT